ncbi:MAG: ABC transporter ATP-binding protein [Firmicutes bacterium]|nr:ABC transporter ATP-binding protein [Bacillota bacterium]
MKDETFRPNRVLSYFQEEWKILFFVTVSGLIYNLGLLAGPWFEGKMTGKLVDLLGGTGTFHQMLMLVTAYVVSIGIVQVSRYFKRFYVRRFANNVNRHMKQILYGTLVRKSRKLALLCMIFPPVSYVIAEKMKVIVQKTGAAYKVQSGALSAATLDRAANAITYRVFGCEEDRKAAYEKNLSAYENAAVRANIWNTAMPPIYRIISMASILFILYFGGRNVLHEGWTPWTIAVFTTFLSCYTKLATKSSSAAKLFNAVHKAQVSWKRIKPLLQNSEAEPELPAAAPAKLSVDHLHFAYPNGKEIIHDLSFEAAPGQIIGVTGPVACGKSTLGKTFLCESPYEGSITFGGKELGKMEKTDRNCIIGYLGHDPELFHGSVEDNIRLGGKQGAEEIIRIVCFEEETKAMEDGIHTLVGTSGVRLSGGQAQRLALARTLYHKRPVLVLDDPFSALDKKTEAQIFANVKELARDSIVILISHRLYLFDQMDQVIWMDEGHTKVGTHEELLAEVPSYAELCRDQTKGGSNDEK